jgi:hypothetical protein
MKDLRLDMPILATTTCSHDNELLKLHPTTLVDAYETRHPLKEKLQIKLGDGHWGDCPTRNRSQVCINPDEVGVLANDMLSEHIKNSKDHKPKSKLYFVELNGTHSMTISMLSFSRNVNSLAKGSYREYSGTYASMKIHNDNLADNFFYTIEDAIKYYVKTSKEIYS